MEILAVVIGYILGISPFVVPKIIEKIENARVKEIEKEKDKEAIDIVDEWFNGPKENRKGINQQDLFNEYMTGEETTKGE